MFNEENYTKEKLTIDIIKANIVAILLFIPIFIIFGIPYYLIWGLQSVNDIPNDVIGNPHKPFVVFALIIGGIIIHELIHGIVWAKYASKGFKSIKFGVIWKMLTPYCHCKEPLLVKQYIWGAIAPAIILGFIPCILAIAIGNLGLLSFGMFFTLAAGGDFMVINILRNEDKNDLTQDHPSEAGCYIFRKKE